MLEKRQICGAPRFQLQLRRLDVYRRTQDTAIAGTGGTSLSWATLRDVGDDDTSLVQLARRVAAEKPLTPASESALQAEDCGFRPATKCGFALWSALAWNCGKC